MTQSTKYPVGRPEGINSRIKIDAHRMKGFSLMELMVVIAVIGIIAAIAGPVINQWRENKQLGGAARDFYASLQQAKLAAIRNNANVGVIVNLATGRCQTFLDDGGPAGLGVANDGFQNGGERILATHDMPGDVVVLIAAADFSGTNIPCFTERALAMIGRTGNVVFQRNGRTDRWYRVVVAPSGQLNLQMSTDSTDGQDGTWS